MTFVNKFIVFIYFLFLFFSFSGFVLANEDVEKNIDETNAVDTAYEIYYQVDEKGLTTATQKIHLFNNFDHLYITEYTLIIGSNNLEDIEVSDNFGEIVPEINVESSSTKLKLVFEDEVVGKDAERLLTIRYKTPDFSFVKGKAMEVALPLFTNSSDLKDYKVELRVPLSFGEYTDIFPLPVGKSIVNGFNVYSYNKTSLINQNGLNATFGKEQLYKFKLRYTLHNPETLKGKTEITLPADTNYQIVLYDDVVPPAENIYVDYDGNWLAEYYVDPGETKEVIVTGQAKVLLKPREEMAKDLSDGQIATWTEADEYWQANDPRIIEVAQSLKTPSKIYEYLVENFIYDYGRLDGDISRYGASQAMANPSSAICMEFTDTFIAMNRAVGIPAREHNGYAYTENDQLRPLSLSQDVLHAWPEYYNFDEKQWIQVDPTWGNTTGGVDFFHKFDLDHFSFVIHGADNSYPVTAGSYRGPETTGKDIDIEFSDSFEPKSLMYISLGEFASGITGIPTSTTAKIENAGNVALYDKDVELQLYLNDELIWEDIHKINSLPPMAKEKLKIMLKTNWRSKGGKYRLIVKLNDEATVTSVDLNRMIDPMILAWVGGGSIGVFLWLTGFQVTMSIRNRKKRRLEEEMEEKLEKEGVKPLVRQL